MSKTNKNLLKKKEINFGINKVMQNRAIKFLKRYKVENKNIF
jgi:hypothetical protein